MNLEELNSLINIKQYLINATNNPLLDRKTVHYMNNLQIMIDKKIIGLLMSDSFKDYINYKDVQDAIKQIAEQNDIKSGIRHKF